MRIDKFLKISRIIKRRTVARTPRRRQNRGQRPRRETVQRRQSGRYRRRAFRQRHRKNQNPCNPDVAKQSKRNRFV